MEWNPTTHYKDIAVAERYDRERFSRLSGRVFNALEKRAVRRAFRSVDRSSVIADLPCGTGRLAETLEPGSCVHRHFRSDAPRRSASFTASAITLKHWLRCERPS